MLLWLIKKNKTTMLLTCNLKALKPKNRFRSWLNRRLLGPLLQLANIFFLLRVGGLTHFLGGQIQIFKYPNNAHTRAHACSIKNFQNFGGYNATASLV